MQQSDITFELRGTLTLGDLLRFQYFNLFRRFWWMFVAVTLVVLTVVLLAAVLVILTHDVEEAGANVTKPVFVFLVWCGIVAVCPYFSARKQMRTQPSIREPISYQFSSQGIHLTAKYSSSEISYKGLWLVRETKSQFCLDLSAGTALLVPKRFFKDVTEQTEWRALLEQGISPKKIVGPDLIGSRF